VVFFDGPEAALEALDLDRDVVEANAAFFIAYAEQLAAAADGDPPSDREPADPWRALSRTSEPWVRHGVLASTYRQAAQFLCLLDLGSAIPLMRRSAEAYLAAGNPFGLFLMTATMNPGDAADTLLEPRYRNALGSERAAGSSFSPAARTDPAQRTYLLLAYCMHPGVRGELGRILTNEHNALEPHGRHPIGPQSTPLAQYLRLCEYALAREGSFGGNRTRIGLMARSIATLGEQQAASLRVARGNRFLWERGAAPVNYCDLELVALVAQTMRGSDLPGAMPEQLDLLTSDPMAAVSSWAGADLFRRSFQAG
jgi:hypothetical protein